MKPLIDKTVDMLSSVLDYRAARHRVISSNIANLDTPGYIPKDLSFRSKLESTISAGRTLSMEKTHKKHLAKGVSEVEGIEYEMSETGDRVNLDTEMAGLAENNLMYNLSIELLARKFRGVKNLLKEAR